MGSGPSLNVTPLELLADEYVWGVNRCYLLYEKIKWKPTFYTAVDDRVVPDISRELNKVIKTSPETQFFLPEVYFISGIIRNQKNTIWFRQRRKEPDKGTTGYFSPNPYRFLRIPNTVTITALQLAVFMGFNPIILIGCDTHYTLPKNIQTSGQTTDPGTGEIIKGYEILSLKNNDPNHFDASYFGKGRKWHAPNVNGMINGYNNVNSYCIKKGIRILNATIGGKLDVFPRVEYQKLFKDYL